MGYVPHSLLGTPPLGVVPQGTQALNTIVTEFDWYQVIVPATMPLASTGLWM